MAYSKTTWVDGSTPALDATHLNNIETGIEGLDTRVTANETTIASNTTAIGSSAASITANATNIGTINTTLDDMVVIRQGTFSGTWQPTLISTFGIAVPTDYNWTITLHQTSRSVQNGSTITLQGYITGDNNTLQFTSTSDTSSVSANYTIVGYKKLISSASIVNQ